MKALLVETLREVGRIRLLYCVMQKSGDTFQCSSTKLSLNHIFICLFIYAIIFLWFNHVRNTKEQLLRLFCYSK